MDRRNFIKMLGVGTAAVVPAITILNPPGLPIVPIEELPILNSEVPQHVYESSVITMDEKHRITVEKLSDTKQGGGCIELHYSHITFIDENDKAVTMHIEDGSLTWTQSQEHIYQLNRGVLDTIVKVEEQPLEISLEILYDWVHQDDKKCGIQMLHEARELYIAVYWNNKLYRFENFRYDTMQFDIYGATFSMSGRCWPNMYV